MATTPRQTFANHAYRPVATLVAGVFAIGTAPAVVMVVLPYVMALMAVRAARSGADAPTGG